MNKQKQKIFKRVLSLMLCIALVFTSIQLTDVINQDISGLTDNEVNIGSNIGAAFNDWTFVSDGTNNGNWIYNATDKYIRNTDNTSNISGFFNPSVNYIDMNISIDVGAYDDNDNDYLGCLIRFSKNSSGNCTGYVFLMDKDNKGTSVGAEGPGLYKISGKSFSRENLTKLKDCTSTWDLDSLKTVNIISSGSNITVKVGGKTALTYTDSSPIANGSYGFCSISQPNATFKNIKGTAKLATYTVSFAGNGAGSSVSPGSKSVISTKTYGDLPTLTRAGYRFDGWFTAASGGSQVTSSTTVTISGNQTLYAHWTALDVNYTVSHHLQGLNDAYTQKEIETKQAKSDTLITLANLKKTYTGFTFNSSKTGTTATVSQNGNSAFILYYSRDKHTVTYDYTTNGGTSATKSTAQVYYEGSIDLSPTAQKNDAYGIYDEAINTDGWEFVGWNTDANATTGLSSLKMSTANVTLYAIFKRTIRVDYVDIKGTSIQYAHGDYSIYNNATYATATLPALRDCTIDNSAATWISEGWGTAAECNAWLNDATKASDASDAGTSYRVTENMYLFGVYSRGIQAQFTSINGVSKQLDFVTGTQVVTGSNISRISNPVITTPGAHTLTYDNGNGAWTFAGWSAGTAPDSSVSYRANQTVAITTLGRYYAIYKRNIPVTFIDYKNSSKNTNIINAEQRSNANKYSTISNSSITIPTINTYTGWTGQGFSSDTSATAPTYVGGETLTITSPMTFYGVYNKDVNIKFHHGNSVQTEVATVTANSSDITGTATTTTTSAPSILEYNNGYVWAGAFWTTSTANNVTSGITLGGDISVSKDTDYYAIYETEYSAAFISMNRSSKTTQYVDGNARVNSYNMSNVLNPTITVPSLRTCTYNGVNWTSKGWTIGTAANSAISKQPGDTLILTGDTTYYGMYASEYTGTFIDYNGSQQRTQTVPMGINLNSHGLETASVPGKAPAVGVYNDGSANWVISGWSSSTLPTGAIDINSEGNFTIEEDSTFYAIYKRQVTLNLVDFNGANSSTFTVTGNATTNSSSITSTSSPALTIPAQKGYVGYTAIGWASTNSAAADVDYYSAQRITTSKDITLYAMYSKDITVTYDGNGGTAPTASIGTQIVNGSGNKQNPTIQITTAVPSRTSLKFMNMWRTEKNSGGSYVAGQSSSFAADTTLYAQWEVKTVNAKVTINWEDNSNVVNSRPNQVVLSLYRDGTKMTNFIVTTLNNTIASPTTATTIPSTGYVLQTNKTGNTDTYTFTGLQKYDPNNGHTYNYTVVQETITSLNDTVDYATTSSGDSWTITNALVDANNKSITGTITWFDDSNAWHFRPTNIVLTLLKTDPDTGVVTKQQKTIKVGAINSLDYVFDKQATFNTNKNPYKYEVLINTIPLYSANKSVENDKFNFELTLTSMPGGFTGGEGNELTITADAFDWKGNHADKDDFYAVSSSEDMSVLITLKTIKKNWNNKVESWNNNVYMTDTNGDVVAYNVIVTPSTNAVVDYLPDGKYELIVHSSMLFDLDKFSAQAYETSGAIVSEENGKYYITYPSAEDYSTILNLHAQVILNSWRGYSSIKETMYEPVHVFGTEYVVSEQPTCTDTGVRYHTCVLCGARADQIEIMPALGHNFVNGVCTRCGATHK